MPLMRLDRLLSECTALSRSQLRQIIKNGSVSVDGIVITSPEHKVCSDTARVELDGKTVSYEKFCYYMLNKPAGILSATDDKKQKTVIDLFPAELKKKNLFPVGRLDKDTTGLLIITNDGDFAHRVISPRSEIVKTYHAVTETPVNDADIEAFRQGIVLADGTKCLPAGLEKLPDGSCLVRVMEGKYHQVKRMLASRGKSVTALMRLSIGGLELDKGLLPGQFRQLSEKELCSVNKKK
ncbi:MAG: rRNA pseudouridine synthase [Clostridiales bacterium]|nr:rRNA pseudouridine synthase [Clostridiales bacterium]